MGYLPNYPDPTPWLRVLVFLAGCGLLGIAYFLFRVLKWITLNFTYTV